MPQPLEVWGLHPYPFDFRVYPPPPPDTIWPSRAASWLLPRHLCLTCTEVNAVITSPGSSIFPYCQFYQSVQLPRLVTGGGEFRSVKRRSGTIVSEVHHSQPQHSFMVEKTRRLARTSKVTLTTIWSDDFIKPSVHFSSDSYHFSSDSYTCAGHNQRSKIEEICSNQILHELIYDFDNIL